MVTSIRNALRDPDVKILVMCEGPNELAVFNVLLDNSMLGFSRSDLLGLTAYHARQIRLSKQVQLALNMFPGRVLVIRVGDKLNEALPIPTVNREKIIGVYKCCTKPELEMLLIIAEDLRHEYEKSGMTPKQFAKAHIKLGRQKYDNSTQFFVDYFSPTPEKLQMAIVEYKRIKRHAGDELFLADLM